MDHASFGWVGRFAPTHYNELTHERRLARRSGDAAKADVHQKLLHHAKAGHFLPSKPALAYARTARWSCICSESLEFQADRQMHAHSTCMVWVPDSFTFYAVKPIPPDTTSAAPRM